MAPALLRTELVGTITWLGRVPHRDRAEVETLPLDEMVLGFGGAAGEVHAGETRLSCSRVTQQYPKGTEIRNTRQVTLASAEELAAIAAEMGLGALDPAWLGVSIVVAGLPDFTHLPPSSRLQGEDGVTLTVDMLNKPCKFPARSIELAHPGYGARFKAAAAGRRGVTAWVERPGTFRRGETVRLHVPGQRAWRGPGEVTPGEAGPG